MILPGVKSILFNNWHRLVSLMSFTQSYLRITSFFLHFFKFVILLTPMSIYYAGIGPYSTHLRILCLNLNCQKVSFYIATVTYKRVVMRLFRNLFRNGREISTVLIMKLIGRGIFVIFNLYFYATN